MTFKLLTIKLTQYAPLLWIMLFVSVILGLGTKSESFVSNGGILPGGIYEAIYLLMIFCMWVSALTHIFELFNNSRIMSPIAKLSTWCTLTGVTLLGARASWLYFTPGIEAHIAPATLAGAITIAVGTAGNSIGRMYDGRHYG